MECPEDRLLHDEERPRVETQDDARHEPHDEERQDPREVLGQSNVPPPPPPPLEYYCQSKWSQLWPT